MAPHAASGAVSAWSMLIVVDPQHGGNEGYEDKPSSYYNFDSTVPNSRKVQAGDLAVIRDGHGLLGIGWIEEVLTEESTKKRLRCPVCRKTGFKSRSTMRPAHRCHDGHTFESPAEETIPVTKFRAIYQPTWLRIPGVLDATELERLTPSRAKQHAIRALALEDLRESLSSAVPESWWADGPG